MGINEAIHSFSRRACVWINVKQVIREWDREGETEIKSAGYKKSFYRREGCWSVSFIFTQNYETIGDCIKYNIYEFIGWGMMGKSFEVL